MLLIFDNVEDVKNIQDFWVASPHISTLITSRTELVTTLPIETITEMPFMDKFRGSEFLLKFANQPKASDADKVSAQELSDPRRPASRPHHYRLPDTEEQEKRVPVS